MKSGLGCHELKMFQLLFIKRDLNDFILDDFRGGRARQSPQIKRQIYTIGL